MCSNEGVHQQGVISGGTKGPAAGSPDKSSKAVNKYNREGKAPFLKRSTTTN